MTQRQRRGDGGLAKSCWRSSGRAQDLTIGHQPLAQVGLQRARRRRGRRWTRGGTSIASRRSRPGSCGSRCWRRTIPSRAWTSWKSLPPTPARATWPWPAGAQGRRASSVYSDGSSELHKLEHVNDGRYGNARSWISAEPGGGWVQVELAEPATIDRVVWARDREGKFRDRLATRYKIDVSAGREHIGRPWPTATIGSRSSPDSKSQPNALDRGFAGRSGRARSLVCVPEAASLKRRHCRSSNRRRVYAGTFKQPEATHLLYRGEPMQKREPVAPGAIAAIGPPLALLADAPKPSAALALARWIGSADNPLAARVLVNRLWHYHFGQGLVNTPSDFGFNGGLPSHPELLDWLASEFVANGWQPQGDAPADHAVEHLSPGQPHAGGSRGQDRCRQPAVVAIRAAAARGRSRFATRSWPRPACSICGWAARATTPSSRTRATCKIYIPKQAVRAGRVAADGLSGQAADAAGRHVRRVRLSRLQPADGAAQHLDHGAAGAEPAQ